MDGWIEHDGKGMPVDGSVKVFVRFKDRGERGPALAKFWDRCSPSCWEHVGIDPQFDIIAYRLASDHSPTPEQEERT